MNIEISKMGWALLITIVLLAGLTAAATFKISISDDKAQKLTDIAKDKHTTPEDLLSKAAEKYVDSIEADELKNYEKQIMEKLLRAIRNKDSKTLKAIAQCVNQNIKN